MDNQEKNTKDQTLVKVKTLEGVKDYNFLLLKRKKAAKVFHESLSVIVRAVSELAMANKKFDVSKIGQAISALDFETLWGLGEDLLAFVIIDGEEIEDINKTDYFTDRPEELYVAIYNAIAVNYPKVFLKLKGAASAFGLQDKLKEALKETAVTEESTTTVSNPGKLRTSK